MIYFLLIYIVYLIGFALFSIAGLYHLWRFGYVGDLTKPVMVVYVIIASLIIVASIVLILTHSWTMGLPAT